MEAIEYIVKLTSIPSPTGYTKDVMSYLQETVAKMGYEFKTTNKGGLMVKVDGKNSEQARMVTAHVDTLGAMVRGIKDDGRLKLEKIGGYPFNVVEGENCLIHGEDRVYTGTILLHQTSVHVYKDAATAERNQDNMEVRLDEKVESKEDTEKLGIAVGDFISLDPKTVVTESGFIKSRHLDDKASAGILLATLEKFKEEETHLPVTTYFYFSNNEEIGYGANSNIPEEVVEYLAVDMGALGDGQTSDEYTVSICAKDSSGPYHYGFRKHLTCLAKEKSIDYRVDIYPHYGSDASAALSAGVDVKHALFGAGIESSHAYERTHQSSIDQTEKLLQAYLLSGLVD